MKKAILILAAVMLVVSGVAAVSAYEAHVINVTSHVENAITLFYVGDGPDYEMDFGTVFPEEWMTKEFKISMSTSFCAYPNQTAIDYAVYVLPKPHPGGGVYPWLGDCLYLGIDTGPSFKPWPNHPAADPEPGDLVHVGYAYPTPPYTPVLTGQLAKPAPQHQVVVVGLDAPVFSEYYNEYTDPEPKPSHLPDPTVIIDPTDTERYHPDGVTLGAEIKVQVTKLYRSAWTPYP
jgi:hypothetical protein